MTKPFTHCSLPDFALEISLAACAAAGSALDAAAAAQLLPRLADAEATEAALQRHPLVRGASGLVCTGTAESRQAWCSMLRDLFSAAGHHQGKVDLGGQAVQGMRRDVGNELILRNKSSRVCRNGGYVGAHANAPAPAALPAHVVHAKKSCVAHKPFLALLVIKKTLALEGLVLRACAY